MQFYVHYYIIVIYIQYRFRVIPSIGYLVIMAKDGRTDECTETQDTQKFWQSKCNNSFITRDILMKLHAHRRTIVIYILYNSEEITSIGYLVIAEDRQCQTYIPPPLASDNETVLLLHLLFSVHYVTQRAWFTNG